MKWIENANKWYMMFSVRMLALIGAIQAVLAVLPPEKAMQPVPFLGSVTWYGLGVTLSVAAAVLGAIGRLIKQDTVSGPPAP